MKLESALKKSINTARLTQKQIGEKLNYSRQQISKTFGLTNDKREMKAEDLKKMLIILNDPILYLQAINYITNNLYGFDDIREDEQHPAVQYFKFNAALKDVVEKVNSYPLIYKEVDKKDVTEVLKALIGLSNAAMAFAAVGSKFYNIQLKNIK